MDPCLFNPTGPEPDRYFVEGGHLICRRVPPMTIAGHYWPIWFMWVEEHTKLWPWWRWKLIDETDWYRPPATCWPIDAKPENL